VNYLDEANKADYSEDGRGLGIDPEIYRMLAETALALWHSAGVEPVTLEGLGDRRPGAVCTLYSLKAAYRIVIDAGQLTLESAALDSPDKPKALYHGQADSITDWAKCQHLVRDAEDPGYYERGRGTEPREIKRAWTRKASDLW